MRHRSTKPTALGAGLRSRPPAVAGCALALVLATLAGCGKKGDPTPPPRLIPAQTGDLSVRQTGDRLVLSLTYPVVTTGGFALPGLQALEILTLHPPPGSTGSGIDASAFASLAKVTERLDAGALSAATRGAQLALELDASPGGAYGPVAAAAAPTPSAAAEPAEPTPVPGPPPILFAVRTVGPRGHPSPLSNVVSIAPRTPPSPPGSLEVAGTAGGVELRWTAPAAEVAGYDVLRRTAGETDFATPLAVLEPGDATYLDAAATFGQGYEYTVRTIAARDPLIESADGPVRAIEHRDVFPPPVPSGLVALAEEGRVRLLWNRVDAADLAGYRVYREEAGGERAELPRDPGTGTDHNDERVRAGVAYVYRVTAVDRDDNESAPSEPASATPR